LESRKRTSSLALPENGAYTGGANAGCRRNRPLSLPEPALFSQQELLLSVNTVPYGAVPPGQGSGDRGVREIVEPAAFR